jgi:hypothetical protein
MAGKLTGPPGWTPDSSMAPPSLTWQERDGFRPSSFGTKFSDTKGGDALKPGAYDEANRNVLANARELITEEDVQSLQVRPAHQPPHDPAEKSTRAAWAEAESNLFDAAESGTSGLWKPFKQRQKEYLEASRVNTALARETAKTAKQEARWAAQDERDTKLKGWLESRTEDQINAFLSSEQFDKLPEHSQNLVHTTLDELGYAAEAEVDLNIEHLEGEEFVIPAPTTPLPWENRAEQANDEVEDEDYTDDEDDSTEYAGGRF